MSVLPQTFFAFMGRHLMSLSLLSVWHCTKYLKLNYLTLLFTSLTKVFAGLNAGIL